MFHSPHLWLQADGENFFGRSVALDYLNLLVVFDGAAEPIIWMGSPKECPELI